MKNLAIITGASGAGKTYALSIFEENGYFIIDNIPESILPNLKVELCSNNPNYEKVALAMPLASALVAYKTFNDVDNLEISTVCIDCSKDVLLERFRLSRRIHPLQTKGKSLNECIDLDHKIIENIREQSTFYVDTSKLDLPNFRKVLYHNLFNNEEQKLTVNFVSFALKKGIPQDVEMFFDLRFLPNPHWVEDLKNLNGLDKPVVEYIFSFPITNEYLEKLVSYLDFYLEQVSQKSSKSISIGVACSGGHHRSVAIAEYLKKYYSKKYNTTTQHRDIDK